MELRVKSAEDMEQVKAHLHATSFPFRVTIAKGDKRSLNQNALLHKWYEQVARHQGDMTAADVKGICHREYGLPIRLRNNQFAWVWERSGAKMTYEQQCKFLASGVLNISSGMSTAELKEYLDTMQQAFLKQGVALVIPEDRT